VERGDAHENSIKKKKAHSESRTGGVQRCKDPYFRRKHERIKKPGAPLEAGALGGNLSKGNKTAKGGVDYLASRWALSTRWHWDARLSRPAGRKKLEQGEEDSTKINARWRRAGIRKTTKPFPKTVGSPALISGKKKKKERKAVLNPRGKVDSS